MQLDVLALTARGCQRHARVLLKYRHDIARSTREALPLLNQVNPSAPRRGEPPRERSRPEKPHAFRRRTLRSAGDAGGCACNVLQAVGAVLASALSTGSISY